MYAKIQTMVLVLIGGVVGFFWSGPVGMFVGGIVGMLLSRAETSTSRRAEELQPLSRRIAALTKEVKELRRQLDATQSRLNALETGPGRILTAAEQVPPTHERTTATLDSEGSTEPELVISPVLLDNVPEVAAQAPGGSDAAVPRTTDIDGTTVGPSPNAVSGTPVDTVTTASPAPVSSSSPLHTESDEARRTVDPPAKPWSATPPTPRPNGAMEDLAQLLGGLTGGNTVARVGVLVLLVGIAFLLKYAADQGVFPIELRLAGAFALGTSLVGIGWRVRDARYGYAISLQGGGLGIVYVTAIAAFRLYELVPASLSFVILAITVALEGWLAHLQRALPLAVLATLSGFAAPILLSTGSGSYQAMFGWYALLNAGVLGLAWRHSWSVLNRLGFIFTFGVATTWGVFSYQATDLGPSETFLLLFTTMYLGIPILSARHHRRQHPKANEHLDAAVVFGLPIAAFMLQAGLFQDIEHGSAWAAVSLGTLWTFAVLWVRQLRPEMPVLQASLLGIAVSLFTLAVPFAFSTTVTGAVWALEGAAFVFVGQRLGSRRWVAVGCLLPFVAGLALALEVEQLGQGPPVANPFQLGALIIATGSVLAAHWLRRNEETYLASVTLLGWGVLFWLGPLIADIDVRYRAFDLRTGLSLLVSAGTGLLLAILGRIARWPEARVLGLLSLGLLAALPVRTMVDPDGPFQGMLAWMWPAAYATWILTLRVADQEDDVPALRPFSYAATYWLLYGTLVAAAYWWGHAHSLERGIFLGGACSFGLLTGLYSVRKLRIWPFRADRDAWTSLAPVPILLLHFVWMVSASLHLSGDGGPPYLPVLNPIDLLLILSSGLITLWIRQPQASFVRTPALWWTLSIGAIAIVSGMVARGVHQFADIPWTFAFMWTSVVLQAALALTWTLLALPIMTVASRRGYRPAWLGGAALLSLVTMKLVFVDLARSGTLARIVSFVGVGLLLLVIGYLAPMPSHDE